jgi:hypothetical protein
MKIRIKRKNKTIIKEAMMMPMDLPEGYYILVDYDPGSIEVSYEFDDSRGDIDNLGLEGAVDASNLFGGCKDDVYLINTANVNIKGYGPMLYDVLMEVLAEDGIMVSADRRLVSEDAWKVWKHYFDIRGSEFEIFRMDISDQTLQYYFGSDEEQWPFKQLSKDTSDDCDQYASVEWAAGMGDWKSEPNKVKRANNVRANPDEAANWHKESISYAFKKKENDDSILEELRFLRMVRGT